MSVSAAECLGEALFQPWHRNDPTFFRRDPEEDVRFALMAGDPTDTAYKPGTQHGAIVWRPSASARLHSFRKRAGRVRPSVTGGTSGTDEFSFAWPIWSEPATPCVIRELLARPDLREIDALAYLGVDHVMVAGRISVGKFMNFSRARLVRPS